MQFSLKPKPCVECGSEPVFHNREYLMLFVNTVVMPFFSSLNDSLSGAFRDSRHAARDSFSFMPVFLNLLVRARIGSYLENYDDKTLLLDQVLWDEARGRGVTMREFRLFGLPLAAFTAERYGKRIAFSSFPTPRGAADAAWWIDTKNILKRKFENLGIPVARGGGAMSWNEAKKIFTHLEAPVIVKPYEGSGSRHTTTHIMDETGLKRAFDISQQISPMSIVEEELKGAVYRPTVVGGKLAATIRRDVPQVVGDGARTIKQLIDEENKNPKRSGPYYQKIIMTEAHLKELARQGHTMQSVPEAGKVVSLHQKINWSVGGTTTDVTDDVHPDNAALFEKIADVLHAPLVGIDFIIEDISKSWKEQERCGVIECNSRPFFDNHHLPFKGKPRNVAGAIWDFAGF
jgi:cyanophycin synthetase